MFIVLFSCNLNCCCCSFVMVFCTLLLCLAPQGNHSPRYMYMYMHVCTICLVCTHTTQQACTCVILNPRQQAAIQIRLTGPDISFVEDRCLLQFPQNISPLCLSSIQITFHCSLRIFPHHLPCPCPQQDLLSPLI